MPCIYGVAIWFLLCGGLSTPRCNAQHYLAKESVALTRICPSTDSLNKYVGLPSCASYCSLKLETSCLEVMLKNSEQHEPSAIRPFCCGTCLQFGFGRHTLSTHKIRLQTFLFDKAKRWFTIRYASGGRGIPTELSISPSLTSFRS